MKLAVFSKFDMAGGSEFRCVEMCNGIVKHTSNEAYLLCEKGFSKELHKKLNSNVKLIEHSVKPENSSIFYEMDNVLVVNTDSKQFTTPEYWEGKSDRHNYNIDLSKIKAMTFLFNFIVSPARHLHKIEKICPNIKIITTNRRFFNELSFKDKHEFVRHFPRMILESPINPDTVTTEKLPLFPIRIGKHSHSVGNKWNDAHKELIEKVNKKYLDKIVWDFMGIPKDREEEVKHFPNVICRKTFSLPVIDYLKGIHIFLFFISWNRQEPWSRSVAEALMSGCPVLATDVDGGNKEQIIHGSNGFLCKDVNDFEKYLSLLIENTELLQKLSRNATFYSKFFSSDEIIRKYIKFIEA